MEPTKPTNNSEEKIDFFLLSAHELRTSLSAMKWLFKMLHDGDYGTLNAEQLAAIDQAANANNTMIALLNDTMTAIKNEGTITYAKNPLHLPFFIAEIVKEFTSEATGKHIGVTYHQSPVPITVITDDTKLRIALHNIIENAIKYSVPNTEISISLSIKGTDAEICVQDHGVGIPADKIDHLFEKFFRAGNSTETGTGLGLYSTKMIIERLGGTIVVNSEQDKGTTVLVTLPLAA